ncbi:MAG: hypothetical protein AAGA72_17920 [Pseudomonadota bacterium]
MAGFNDHHRTYGSTGSKAQLGDTFLSSKHFDHMAATAELVRTGIA